jgi:hypothetical protein
MNYLNILNKNIIRENIIKINNKKIDDFPKLSTITNTTNRLNSIDYSKINFISDLKSNCDINFNKQSDYCVSENKVIKCESTELIVYNNNILDNITNSDKIYLNKNKIDSKDFKNINKTKDKNDKSDKTNDKSDKTNDKNDKTKDKNDIIVKIKKEYFNILENKQISDHLPIVSTKSNIISWNVQKDSSFFEIYNSTHISNNLENFPVEQREKINEIYGIGYNLRNKMESEPEYNIVKFSRYNKICDKIKSLLFQNGISEKNVSTCNFRICLQECNYELYEYLKSNLKFEHIKFIGQDIGSFSIGKINDFTKDLEYLLNWYNLKPENKNNQKINDIIHSNPEWKNKFNLILNQNKNINLKLPNKKNKSKSKSKDKTLIDKSIFDSEWKNFVLENNKIWEDFIDYTNLKHKQNQTHKNLNENYNYTGSVIISNEPFLIFPCFSRILFTNCVLSAEKITDTFGAFVIKSRGCLYVDFQNKNPFLINVHLPKNRISYDFLKIFDNDFFSIGFEKTSQIDKYFFCEGSTESIGLDHYLNNFYKKNTELIYKLKKIFLSNMSKKLYKLFIDKILQANNISKSEYFDNNQVCLDFNNKIFFNNINFDNDVEVFLEKISISKKSNISGDLDLNEFSESDEPNDLEEYNQINKNIQLQNYLDKDTVKNILKKLYDKRKLIVAGDYNCQLNKLLLFSIKHYTDKFISSIKNKYINDCDISYDEKMNLFLDELENTINKKNNNSQTENWVVSSIYESSRIDHIIELEFQEKNINFINNIINLFIKLAKESTNSLNQIEKQDNIITFDANCNYKKEYYNIPDVFDFDVPLEILKPNEQAYMVSKILLDLLFEYKMDYIMGVLEENVVFQSNKITTKIYIQNITYHFVDQINKNKTLKFQHIKFIGQILTSIYLTDVQKYLSKPIDTCFNKKEYETINKLYNDYNNFGFCVLSNEPVFVMPSNPECLFNINLDFLQFDKNNQNNLNNHNKAVSLNIFIKTNGCVDLTNGILMINKFKNLELFIKDNMIKCANLNINDYNILTDLTHKEQYQLVNLIKYLRYLLIDKYIRILIDINRLEQENIYLDNSEYSIDKYLSQLNNFKIQILKDEFILNYNKSNHNKLTIFGQFTKYISNENSELSPKKSNCKGRNLDKFDLIMSKKVEKKFSNSRDKINFEKSLNLV